MGRLKLRGERDDEKKARKELRGQFPSLLPDCTWILCLGVHGDVGSKNTGDLFEAEARRRGAPFVISEHGGSNTKDGDIPVVVVYAELSTYRTTVKKMESARPNGAAPFVLARSLRTGAGVASHGPQDPTAVKELFDLAVQLAQHKGTTS